MQQEHLQQKTSPDSQAQDKAQLLDELMKKSIQGGAKSNAPDPKQSGSGCGCGCGAPR